MGALSIKRHMKVRRLPKAERKALGLEPGVGYTDAELTRFRFYRMLAAVIAREMREARSSMTPLARIGFDGRAPHVEFVADRLPHEDMRGVRNTAQSPVDALYFQSKAPIEYWEWLACKRFEYDWRCAHDSQRITTDLTSLSLAKTHRMSAAEKRRVVTFFPRGAKRARSAPTVPDSRLDAMARLGRLQAVVDSISFWLLERVCGHELTLAQCAQLLGVDSRYISQRFREAIWRAAEHYRIGAQSEGLDVPGWE